MSKVSVLFSAYPVLVRGGGDLASGVVYRLVKIGFPVVITELARPLVIRRAVAFAAAVFEGYITVEGLTARHVDSSAAVPELWNASEIPVLVDVAGDYLPVLKPAIVVDARLAKRNLDTTRDDASLVIALGPGFEAGRECHAVIETQRGHALGRVIWQGRAAANTGQPGRMAGYAAERVLYAPADGFVTAHVALGARVQSNAIVASVGDVPVQAPFDGVLRGLIHPTVPVTRAMKIGDVDPRGRREYCFTISDKALAIGGGVVEAIFSAPQLAGWFKDVT